jgi:hypothetical protein
VHLPRKAYRGYILRGYSAFKNHFFDSREGGRFPVPGILLEVIFLRIREGIFAYGGRYQAEALRIECGLSAARSDVYPEKVFFIDR